MSWLWKWYDTLDFEKDWEHPRRRGLAEISGCYNKHMNEHQKALRDLR